jgi:hypothetical protein
VLDHANIIYPYFQSWPSGRPAFCHIRHNELRLNTTLASIGPVSGMSPLRLREEPLLAVETLGTVVADSILKRRRDSNIAADFQFRNPNNGVFTLGKQCLFPHCTASGRLGPEDTCRWMVVVEFLVVLRRRFWKRGFGSRSAVRLEVVFLRARIDMCGRRSPSTTISSPTSFPERRVDDDIKDAFEVVEEYGVGGAFED